MTSIYNPDREGFTYKPHGRCRTCNTELRHREGHCLTAFVVTRVVHSFCKSCHGDALCDCSHAEGCNCWKCE